jgi:hypothetical protein
VAEVLPPEIVTLARAGADRPVLGIEILEAGGPTVAHHGELVLVVGHRDSAEVLACLGDLGDAAGVVLRRRWADEAAVQQRCDELGLVLLAVADDAPWSRVLAGMRSALDATAGSAESVDQVYGDLFELADRVSTLLGAPVTIEDATSRVLAYSTGQEDVDDARLLSIVGRQVPREVREHFRSRGVFRHLASSDEPLVVPAGEDGTKPRLVIPVRAGSEWLGSVWAVVDAPVSPRRSEKLAAATQTLALLLLRLRAQSELQQHLELDRVRTLLRGGAGDLPAGLEEGPWRVAVLHGPDHLTAESRCELWTTLARRNGWGRPLVADADGTVYGILREEGAAPGSWRWLASLVRQERVDDPTIWTVAGRPVSTLDRLPLSRTEGDEVSRLPDDQVGKPVASVESAWAHVVLARAMAGMAGSAPVAPLRIEDDRDEQLRATLEAVIDHWGQPQRAARALDVHPNTIRYRMGQIAEVCDADLEDPVQRLALKLEFLADRWRPSAT